MKTGDLVRFNHERDGGPVHRVVSVMSDGMLELHDMGGYFAPHLFTAAEDVADIPPFLGAPIDLAQHCQHEEFAAEVGVHRLCSKEGGPVTGYTADVRIRCARCGQPFQFLGLEPGVDTHGARVSVDGLEAHLALSPKGAQPSPLQHMAFNVRRFDG